MPRRETVNALDGLPQYAKEVLPKYFRDKVLDAYLTLDPLITILMMQNGIVKKGFGTEFKFPVVIPTNDGHQVSAWGNPFTEMPLPQDTPGVMMAKFVCAHFYCLLDFNKLEIARANGSDVKIFDIIQNAMTIAITKWKAYQLSHLWAAESTSGANGTAEDRIGSVLAYLNAASSTGTFGSGDMDVPVPTILGYSQTVLNSGSTEVGLQRASVGGLYYTPRVYNPGTASTMSANALNSLINYSTFDGKKPATILTGPKLYSYLQSILQGQQRDDLSNYGFAAFDWLGTRVVMSHKVPEATDDNTVLGIAKGALEYWVDGITPSFMEYQDARYLNLERHVSTFHAQLIGKDLGPCNFRHDKFANPA